MEFWNDGWGRFLSVKSLRPKLLLIVALALGPLALASIGQGLLRFQTRQEELQGQILQMAVYATGNERNILSSVDLYLQELAQRPEIRNADANCAITLSNTLIGRPLYLNVLRVDANGKTMCGASSALLTSDYSHFAWWPQVRKQNGTLISPAYRAHGAGTTVLPASFPLRDRSGAFIGAITASVDLAWLNRRMEYGTLSPDTMMFILTKSGDVLASNRPAPMNMLKKSSGTTGSLKPGVFGLTDANGRRWQWVAQDIKGNGLIVAFGVPQPGIFDVTRVYFLADILLPLLMIALASVAIWLGTEWLVVRWTTYLQRVSVAYGQNHFALELTELEDAPEEFRRLGNEMKTMAGSIRDRDRKLNRAVEAETAMAREIHHRVKNNLQIVSSLINLYSRRINDAQARIAFRQILMRVDALTLVHRLIEKNDAVPVVEMKSLLTEMADQIGAIAAEGGRSYRVTVDTEARQLPAALATPIALFAVEMLSFGIFRNDDNPSMRAAKLTFVAETPSELVLTIEDNSISEDELCSGLPSPQRFLTSFAEQLQGRISVEPAPGGGIRLSLRIPFDTSGEAAREADSDGPRVFQFRTPAKAG